MEALNISDIQIDVSAILDDLAQILALDSKSEIRSRLFNLSLTLETFYNKFNSAYEDIKKWIDVSQRSISLTQMHNLSISEINFSEQTDNFKKKIAYENMLNILLEGYRLTHGIRDILTNKPITYTVVYSYKEEGISKTYAYDMTFEELLKYTTPTLLGRASSAENALVTLQLRLKKEIQQLDKDKKDLTNNALYNNVLAYTGRSHTRPSPNANTVEQMKKNKLIEVFYQLLSVGYTGTRPRNKMIHHFYDKSLNPLSNILGGDVLNKQLKSTGSFDLTRVTTVHNTLDKLIKTLKESSKISSEQLERALTDIFIQKNKTDIINQTNRYVKRATKNLSSMIDEEISGIQRLTCKLKI